MFVFCIKMWNRRSKHIKWSYTYNICILITFLIYFIDIFIKNFFSFFFFFFWKKMLFNTHYPVAENMEQTFWISFWAKPKKNKYILNQFYMLNVRKVHQSPVTSHKIKCLFSNIENYWKHRRPNTEHCALHMSVSTISLVSHVSCLIIRWNNVFLYFVGFFVWFLSL